MNGLSFTVIGDLERLAIRAHAPLKNDLACHNLTELGFQAIDASNSLIPSSWDGWERAQLGTLDIYEKLYRSREDAETDARRLDELGYTQIGGIMLLD